MEKEKKWKLPPKIKIYEAMGAMADGRIEMDEMGADGVQTGRVFSSSRNKFYVVYWCPGKKAIMTNDNGTYWQGYLGYPAVAFLMKSGLIKFEPRVVESLAGVAWKDVNVKFKNQFEKTVAYVADVALGKGVSKRQLESAAEEVLSQLEKMELVPWGRRIRPPKGY